MPPGSGKVSDERLASPTLDDQLVSMAGILKANRTRLAVIGAAGLAGPSVKELVSLWADVLGSQPAPPSDELRQVDPAHRRPVLDCTVRRKALRAAECFETRHRGDRHQ